MSTATGQLRRLAADWGLGGVVNALDEISKRHGVDEMPPSAIALGTALLRLIDDLDLHRADHPVASDIWRVRP